MCSPEMAELIDRIRSAVPFERFTVAAHRGRVDRAEALVPTPPEAEIAADVLGGVPAEWIVSPGFGQGQVLVMLHHGAFVAGSSRSLHAWAAQISAAANVRVLAPNYRLAPEAPFPAAIEDAVACYRALLDRGFGPERIVLGGVSAGGGIAAGALLALRDGGGPLPAAMLLVCPLLDTTLTSTAMRAETSEEPIDSRPISAPAVALYLGDASPRHPWASPVLADLAGLPPVLVEAAGADRLVDDARTFAARAAEAGVRVRVTVTPGAIHNFPQSGPHTPEAVEATERVAAFLSEVLPTGRVIPTATDVPTSVD